MAVERIDAVRWCFPTAVAIECKLQLEWAKVWRLSRFDVWGYRRVNKQDCKHMWCCHGRSHRWGLHLVWGWGQAGVSWWWAALTETISPEVKWFPHKIPLRWEQPGDKTTCKTTRPHAESTHTETHTNVRLKDISVHIWFFFSSKKEHNEHKCF